jgi:hypothetical protein
MRANLIWVIGQGGVCIIAPAAMPKRYVLRLIEPSACGQPDPLNASARVGCFHCYREIRQEIDSKIRCFACQTQDLLRKSGVFHEATPDLEQPQGQTGSGFIWHKIQKSA